MRFEAQDIARFRDWLERSLRASQWWRFGKTAEQAKVWGPKLGLMPDVLMAAYQIKQEEDASGPYRRLTGPKVNDHDNPQLYVDFCKDVWDAWHDRCDHLHLKSSVLFRGLVNSYLLGDWEPVQVGKSWVWRRQTYTKADRKLREQCLVSRGAREALRVRAQRGRTTVQGLLRGIILEYLDGSVEPILVEARRMFEDPLRYLPEPEEDSNG